MLRIGLFGVGLDTYWSQFPGLLERLGGYQAVIADRLKTHDITVVDAGMVDNPLRTAEAASLFRREEVDLIFLNVATYALSSIVLPVVQRAGVPVVVLESAAGPPARLRRLQRAGRPREDDGRLAGTLPGLLRAGDRLRPQPRGDRLSPRHRLPPGRRGVAGNRRLDRGRQGPRRDAGEPRRHPRTLLLRHVGRLQRPDPTIGRLRQPFRVAGNGRSPALVEPGQRRADGRQAAAVPRGVRRRSALLGPRTRACGQDLVRVGCAGGKVSARRPGLLLRGRRGQRRSRTSSPASSREIPC